jgi:putative nucleotidyltransferase with HDIG domain
MTTREDAWNLLCEFTEGESLRKHALAVEAGMRAYACRFDGDEETWGIVGLIHDFDYEQHPSLEEHPLVGARILLERGWPEEIIRAVKSHAQYLEIPRQSKLEQALFAVDELTGLIVAVALVRPSRNICDVKVRSVMKKWKDRRFAAGVNRQDIEDGAAALGIPLRDHIAIVLEAMQSQAEALGLAGNPP